MISPALLLVGLLSSPTGAEERAPHFLTPAEMYRRMDASPVKYTVRALKDLTDVPHDKLADALWPARAPRLPFPTVVVRGGHREVVPYDFDPASMRLVEQAEPDFQAKRYAKAQVLYRQAVEASPKNVLAWSDLGDCALDQGDAREALADYEKARALDPVDYRVWFYEGDALGKLGKRAESLRAYATSLVLNPRNPILLGKLKKAGLPIGGDLIQPKAFVRKEGDAVAIYAEVGPWLPFALCKALWLGEPSRRAEAHLDDAEWSSFEETECLASLVAVYEGGRGKAGFVADPALDALSRIALQDKMLDELAVYELGSRLDPHVTLRLSDEQRARLERFVLRHVLHAPVTQH